MIDRAANLWVWNQRRYGLDTPDVNKTKFEIVFENPTEKSVDIYWSSTLMTTMGPKSKQLYTTYTGHKWTMKEGETVLLEFVGNANDGTVQSVVVPMENKEEL